MATDKNAFLVPLLILLSATTGLVDAASVLGMGQVFTANMTGNVVFLGFAVAGTKGYNWLLCLGAIACFALGALGGGRIALARAGGGHRGWLMRVAGIETLLLWLAALAAFTLPETEGVRLLMVALTAAAMGLRNATVRHMKVPDLTTTVLTLTITGIAADSQFAGGANPNLARRFGAVFAILIGAGVGAALLHWGGLGVPLALAGAIVLFATVALVRNLPAAQV